MSGEPAATSSLKIHSEAAKQRGGKEELVPLIEGNKWKKQVRGAYLPLLVPTGLADVVMPSSPVFISNSCPSWSSSQTSRSPTTVDVSLPCSRVESTRPAHIEETGNGNDNRTRHPKLRKV